MFSEIRPKWLLLVLFILFTLTGFAYIEFAGICPGIKAGKPGLDINNIMEAADIQMVQNVQLKNYLPKARYKIVYVNLNIKLCPFNFIRS